MEILFVNKSCCDLQICLQFHSSVALGFRSVDKTLLLVLVLLHLSSSCSCSLVVVVAAVLL